MNKFLTILLSVLFLGACQSQAEVVFVPTRTPETAVTPTTIPASATAVIVPVTQVLTPDPTPTTAVCTPLPPDMHIHIRREGDLQGMIDVTGLQPQEQPLILLTGETTHASWSSETDAKGFMDEDGRLQYPFDFRSWPSIEGYAFQGRLIHERGVACFGLELPLTEPVVAENRDPQPETQPLLFLEDYPPSETPYFIAESDLWLVHTPAGQRMAFPAYSPAYKPEVAVEPCRFAWSESVQRFVDPCSGDEWALNGRLNLEHSTELWSNRHLDQYMVSVVDGQILVQVTDVIQAQSIDAVPLAMDTQFGITMTAVLADFTVEPEQFGTRLDTVVQVDPIWQMDASAFPPQQALAYHTVPHSLLDDKERAFSGGGRLGSFAVVDSATGGLVQTSHNSWPTIPTDAHTVTATLTIDLGKLHREIPLPLVWEEHQEGDSWDVEIPLDIGHASAEIRQIEWVKTLGNGRARLRLTVHDTSPEGLDMTCLHLAATDPWQASCANFSGQKTYTVDFQPGEVAVVHVRAMVTLTRPFQLALSVP